jgi:hypothetical protein
VFQEASGQWVTRLDDLSTGLVGVMITGDVWGVGQDSGTTVTVQGSTSALSYSGGYHAEWIVEDPADGATGSLLPFADYGTVTFSNLAASIASWSLTPANAWEIVDNGAVVSTPAAPTGDGFSVSYTG